MTINRRQESGIALVIVLGLLALMMLLGVAFSIYMRTEQLAAGNYRSDVRMRQLLNSGLTRVMADTDAQIDKTYPYPTAPGTNAIYPQWDAFCSTDPNALAPIYADVLTGEAQQFVPFGALRADGQHTGARLVYLVDGNANWPVNGNKGQLTGMTVINLNPAKRCCAVITNNTPTIAYTAPGTLGFDWDTGDPYRIVAPQYLNTTVNGRVVGRIAYLVFNSSGFLDANYAGGLARGVGTNAGEIWIASIPGLKNAGADFRNDRGLDGRYETVQELSKMNTGFTWSNADFTTYSRYPMGWPDDAGKMTNQLDIGGTTNDLLLHTGDIIAALQSAGPSDFPIDNNAAHVILNELYDYIDSDSVPTDLASPCTEAVPMINEVQFYCGDYTFDTFTNVTGTIQMHFELTEPFPELPSDTRSFTLYYRLLFPAGPLFPANNSADNTAYEGRLTVDMNNANNNFPWDCRAQNIMVKSNYANYFGTSITLDKKVGFQAWLTVDSGPDAGAIVDSAPSPAKLPATLANCIMLGFTNPPIQVPNSAPATPIRLGPTIGGAECIDPRFNWMSAAYAGGGQQWNGYVAGGPAGTLNLQNFWATNKWFPRQVTDGDPSGAANGAMMMHVANDRLRSVAELGYLARGNRYEDQWNTLRVMDRMVDFGQGNGPELIARDRILDRFVIGTNSIDRISESSSGANGSVFRGKVNPNTADSNVLAAVFSVVPLDNYPGDPSPVGTLSPVLAGQLAQWWVNTNLNIYAGRIRELSDIGHMSVGPMLTLTNFLPAPPAISAPLTLFQQESLIRNSVGLFGLRQNLFTVLVRAEATESLILPDQTPTQTVLSVGRAVSEVWRDPFPRELPPGDTNHVSFVRFFRILEQ